MLFIFSLAVLLSFLALVARLDAFPATQNYCATFAGGAVTNGITGYFGVSINSATGYATYGYGVNFNGMTVPNSINALSWHIHTGWTDTAATSGSLATCAQTAGHYDPDLACSPGSQGQTTTIQGQTLASCVALGRTAATYTYGCTPALYDAGNFGLCEVGDLSGKFGKLTTSAGNLALSTGITPLVDPNGAYVNDYGTVNAAGNGNTLQWNSIVFHDDFANKILCGKLVPDSDPNSQCNLNYAYGGYVPPPAPVPYVNPTSIPTFTSSSIVVAVALTFIITLAPFFIFWMKNLMEEDAKKYAATHTPAHAPPTTPAPAAPSATNPMVAAVAPKVPGGPGMEASL